MKYTILLISLLAFNATEAREKYYKWTDAEGTIHYSKKKPQETQVSEVKIHDSVSTSPQSQQNDANDSTEPEKSAEEKQIDAYNQALKEKSQRFQDKANCKIAKNNLLELQRTLRVSRKDPKTGQRIRLSDNERVQMMATAKQQIKNLCQ